MKNITRWSNAKLEKELHFARAAKNENDQVTIDWLHACEVEGDRRSRLSEIN